MIERRTFVKGLALGILAAPVAAEAQPTAKVYRVGVVHPGGPFATAVDGLRDGLKALGFDEEKQYVLHIREVTGDLRAVAETAKNLEKEKVDLIYAIGSSVAVEAQRATASVPIVFYSGSDPVASGLVKSLAKPGGRLTGVHSRASDLIPKRLEFLKQIVPGLRRVLTFYDPGNAVARDGAMSAREAARKLQFEVVERHVRTAEELRAGLRGLKAGEVDALFLVGDGMVISQLSSSSRRRRPRSCRRCSPSGAPWRREGSPAMARATMRWAARRRSTSTGCSWARAPRICRSRGLTGMSWSSTQDRQSARADDSAVGAGAGR